MKAILYREVRSAPDRKREVFELHVDIALMAGKALYISVHKRQSVHMVAGKLKRRWVRAEIEMPVIVSCSPTVAARCADGIRLAVVVAKYLDKTKPEDVTKRAIQQMGAQWDRLAVQRKEDMVRGRP